MVKITINNAEAEDRGYGLRVNDIPLDCIISTALGTLMEAKSLGVRTGEIFKSNCCNITVTIDPMPEPTIKIEDDEWFYEDLKTLEEDRHEQFSKKNTEKDAEE